MKNELINKIQTTFSLKLAALLTVFSMLMLTCFAGVRYAITSADARESLKNTINNELKTATAVTSGYISDIAANTYAVAENPAALAWFSGDESGADEAVNMCRTIAAGSRAVKSIWLIRDSDGKYISSSDSGEIKLNKENWYANLYINSSQLKVFVSESGIGVKEECVTLVSAAAVNGRVIGFVGEELPVSAVKEFYGNIELSSGSLIVTDSDDTLIYAPDSISDPVSVSKGRSNYCTAVTYEQISRWNICVAADYESENLGRIKAFRKEMLLLMALLVLMVAVILKTVHHECKRIPQISRSIAEISAGNYNFRINDSTNNEIGLIAQSVDRLAQTLQEKNAIIDEYTNTDTLTGAWNRVKMYEAIDDYIDGRDETRPRFAIIFFDIDNFKWINETLGHRYGDAMLKEYSDRIKTAFGKVYRFASDMFVAIVDIEDDPEIVDKKISSFTDILDEPITVFASPLYIRSSEGIAVYPDDGKNADILLQCAEIALSRSKEKGKNRFSYFSRTQHSRVTNKTAISQMLTHALEKGEFYLNYQPIISTADRSLHGFEVLLRWESEELGYIPPANFVDIAEETGEIIKIGTWIFETGCRFLKQINEYNKDVIMSINVSAVQLSRKGFMENVCRVLNITKVNPANIQIEITESCLVDFGDKSAEYIRGLSELGLGIALDDFGTGYSSLSYLQSLPITCLKVDKSFVDNIAAKENDYKITDSIIDMVHGMGIKTVAEGVETIAQYNSIVDMKCDYIQGFLMSKPMAESAALEFVKMYEDMYKPDNSRLMESEMRLLSEKG